ncbi:hypothetical protein C8F01DRAFT_1094434 [Mycena amicta]|nr:hypothetical protein C8F01DRAFT_1094434 [Mycena amicta]
MSERRYFSCTRLSLPARSAIVKSFSSLLEDDDDSRFQSESETKPVWATGRQAREERRGRRGEEDSGYRSTCAGEKEKNATYVLYASAAAPGRHQEGMWHEQGCGCFLGRGRVARVTPVGRELAPVFHCPSVGMRLEGKVGTAVPANENVYDDAWWTAEPVRKGRRGSERDPERPNQSEAQRVADSREGE